MAGLARRLLGAAAASIARKLLPGDPGTALALRSDTQLAPPNQSDFFPTAYPSPYMQPQPVALPPTPPRPRRRIVVIEETTWRS